MNKSRRKALKDAGFKVGSVQEFLGLTDVENRMVELKHQLSKEVKSLRLSLDLSQGEVAKRIGSSQSRIAKIEAGSADVSLDLLVRCLLGISGSCKVICVVDGPPASGKKRPSTISAKKKKLVSI